MLRTLFLNVLNFKNPVEIALSGARDPAGGEGPPRVFDDALRWAAPHVQRHVGREMKQHMWPAAAAAAAAA
jgi:hypothetical protein